MKGALEENVLTMLCWDVANAPALAMRLDPWLFSTKQYQDIAKAAIEHINSYSKPPQGHIRDLLETKLNRGKDGELLWLAVDAMAELKDSLQPDYVLSELEKFVELRTIAQAIEEAADAVQAGDPIAAREALYKQQKSQPLSKGIYLSNSAESLSFMDDEANDEFTMGVEALDERGIRPARGELTVLIAPAKRGKTQFLTNLGVENIKLRKKVLHVTLENGEKKMCQRYVQTLLGLTKKQAKTVRVPIFKRGASGVKPQIDFDTFTPDTLAPENRTKVTQKLANLLRRGPLLIKEFPMGTLTIAQLNAYLDWLANSENFIPDLIILDYPGIMAIDPTRLRIELGRIFVGLKGICSEQARNCAMVVVAQGNRTSSTAKTVKANQVGEDYSIIGSADTVLTYSQTADERGLGLARLFVAASRHDADQYVVLVSQAYDTAQFCLDSVYLEKHFEDEIARLTGNANEDDND